MMLKRDIGNKGEDIAVKLLKKKGYKIIERNFNAGVGEIDIIAKDGEYLCFVEVRLRKDDLHGTAKETVDIFKQKKIVKAALAYMKLHGLTQAPSRFDVAAITGDPCGKYTYEIIQNAFEAYY